MNQYYLLALLWATCALGCTSAWEVAQQSSSSSPSGVIAYTNSPATPSSSQEEAIRSEPQDEIIEESNQESESFFDFIAKKPEESAIQTPITNTQPVQPAHSQSSFVADASSTTHRKAQTKPMATVPAVPSNDQLIAVDRNLLWEWKQALDAILLGDESRHSTPTQAPTQISRIQRPPIADSRPKAPSRSSHEVASAQVKQQPQDQWDEFSDPNDLLFREVEQRMDQPATQAHARSAPVQQTPKQIAQPVAETSTRMGFVPVQLTHDHRILLNEHMLVEWEKELIASRSGRTAEVALPTWLLQGLEWLTDAPSEEPERSQVLMPLYRHMKNSNYFADVNLNKMTPGQIVAKLRMLVEDAKQNQATLLQGP